jgi:hypothetical protein
MRGNGHQFYEIPESELLAMVEAHYMGKTRPTSEFSSWTASLHLVLRYAERLNETHNAHIAIIDTKDLDGDVLVWHVPHFMHARGVDEYMAHGRIAGLDYKAVSLKALKAEGLLEVFPEIAMKLHECYNHCCGWGMCVRKKMFTDVPRHLKTHELDHIIALAGLFGHLSLPVATALICIRPRPWVRLRRGIWKRLLQGCKTTCSEDQTLSEVTRRFEGAGNSINLRKETWLRRDAVDTGTCYEDDYPDIRQWIDLLRAIRSHNVTNHTTKDELEGEEYTRGWGFTER